MRLVWSECKLTYYKTKSTKLHFAQSKYDKFHNSTFDIYIETNGVFAYDLFEVNEN